jgi:hypothetical protein
MGQAAKMVRAANAAAGCSVSMGLTTVVVFGFAVVFGALMV